MKWPEGEEKWGYRERRERARESSILSVKHRDLALHGPRWLWPSYNICRTWWATIYGSKDLFRLSSSASSSSIMSVEDQHKWLFSKENQKMKNTSVKRMQAKYVQQSEEERCKLNSTPLCQVAVYGVCSSSPAPRKLSVDSGQAKTRLKMLSSCWPFCSCILIFFFDIFLYPALEPVVTLLTAELHLIFIGLIVFLQARKLSFIVKFIIHYSFIIYSFIIYWTIMALYELDIKIRFESKFYLFMLFKRLFVWSKYFIFTDFLPSTI